MHTGRLSVSIYSRSLGHKMSSPVPLEHIHCETNSQDVVQFRAFEHHLHSMVSYCITSDAYKTLDVFDFCSIIRAAYFR